jgi:hypothetical protein
MTRMIRSTVGLGIAFLSLTYVASAAAQAGTVVTPIVSAGRFYDSNIFFTPVAEVDTVWRATAGLGVSNVMPQSIFDARYSFDSEWYGKQTDLSTPFARQNAAASYAWHSPLRVTVLSRANFDRTRVPSELNLTTGIVPGRLQSWRLGGDTTVTSRLTPHTTFTGAGAYAHEAIDVIGSDDALSGRAEFGWDATARDQLGLKYLPEFIIFGDQGAPSQMWHTVAVGWTHAITKVTRLSIEGGPRWRNAAASDVLPYIFVRLARSTPLSDGSIAYTRTVTTALGILAPVETQNLLATAAYHLPGTFEASIQGGAYRNVIGGLALDVYRVGGSVTAHIAGPVSLLLTGSHDRQVNRLVTNLLPAETSTLTVSRQDAFNRDVIGLQILVTRVVHRRATPKGDTAAGAIRFDRRLP